MVVLIVLIAIFTILITYIIFTTIMKVALFLTTKKNYDYRVLIIPFLLNLIVWSAVIVGFIATLKWGLKKDIISFLLSFLLSKSNFLENSIGTLLIAIGFVILGIILQAFAYLTVNIDYGYIKHQILLLIKKITKKQPKGLEAPSSITDEKKEETKTNYVRKKIAFNGTKELVPYDKTVENLTFGNALIASLFSFSSVFFCLMSCFFLGMAFSSKFIA